jgi:hypothetical protein
LLVAGLFREKSTAGWWLISRANRLQTQNLRHTVHKLPLKFLERAVGEDGVMGIVGTSSIAGVFPSGLAPPKQIGVQKSISPI